MFVGLTLFPLLGMVHVQNAYWTGYFRPGPARAADESVGPPTEFVIDRFSGETTAEGFPAGWEALTCIFGEIDCPEGNRRSVCTPIAP